MKHLIFARKAKKMTQKDVADILGVDRTTYGKYETGDSDPPTSTIAELCSIFQVSSDYLIGLSNDPSFPENKEIAGDVQMSETDRHILESLPELTEEEKAAVNSLINHYVNNKKKENDV